MASHFPLNLVYILPLHHIFSTSRPVYSLYATLWIQVDTITYFSAKHRFSIFSFYYLSHLMQFHLQPHRVGLTVSGLTYRCVQSLESFGLTLQGIVLLCLFFLWLIPPTHFHNEASCNRSVGPSKLCPGR